MRAIWNDRVLAESDATILVEGDTYFPPESVHRDHLRDSGRTSIHSWMGTAVHYTVTVDGEDNVDAAWFFPDPLPPAHEIAGYIAFRQGVRVEP